MPSSAARITRLVRLERLGDCLQWVLPHYSVDRAAWIINRLTHQVHCGGAQDILAVATFTDATNDPANHPGQDPVSHPAGDYVHKPAATSLGDSSRQFAGVAIAVTQPGRVATLLALHVIGETAPGELIAPLLRNLADRGVNFIQAASETQSQANLLAASGFEWLADLVLMSLESDRFDAVNHQSANQQVGRLSDHETPALTSESIAWVGLDELGEDWRSQFSRIATQTFTATQDCPRLSQFRTTDEIVRGFIDTPHFERRLGSLLRVGDQWAGCLILTAHRSTDQPETGTQPETADPAFVGVMEIAYMGVVPGFRGRGFATHLLRRAVGQATVAGASQIVLAVDRENHPAIASYRRLGWCEVVGETVWGKKI